MAVASYKSYYLWEFWCVSCGVGLRCGVIVVCGSHCVKELRCGGVVLCGGHGGYQTLMPFGVF